MEGLFNGFDPRSSATPTGVFDVQKEVKYIKLPRQFPFFSYKTLHLSSLVFAVSYICHMSQLLLFQKLFSLEKLHSFGRLELLGF